VLDAGGGGGGTGTTALEADNTTMIMLSCMGRKQACGGRGETGATR